jgi:hypothetical protein
MVDTDMPVRPAAPMLHVPWAGQVLLYSYSTEICESGTHKYEGNASRHLDTLLVVAFEQ